MSRLILCSISSIITSSSSPQWCQPDQSPAVVRDGIWEIKSPASRLVAAAADEINLARPRAPGGVRPVNAATSTAGVSRSLPPAGRPPTTTTGSAVWSYGRWRNWTQMNKTRSRRERDPGSRDGHVMRLQERRASGPLGSCGQSMHLTYRRICVWPRGVRFTVLCPFCFYRVGQ